MLRKIDKAFKIAERRIGIDNLFCIFYDMDKEEFSNLKARIDERKENERNERERQRDHEEMERAYEKERQRIEHESRMEGFEKFKEKRLNEQMEKERQNDDHESRKEDSKSREKPNDDDSNHVNHPDEI